MKKIISVILCLIMVMSITTSAFAIDGEALVTADNVAVNAGDTAHATIYLDADVKDNYTVTNGRIYLWFDVEFDSEFTTLKSYKLSQQITDMGGYTTTLENDTINGITSVIACVVIPSLSVLSAKTPLINLEITVSDTWDKRDIPLLCNCGADLGNDSYIYSNGKKTTIDVVSSTGSIYQATEEKTIAELVTENLLHLWQIIQDYFAILVNYIKSLG